MNYGFPIIEKFVELMPPELKGGLGWFVMTKETTMDHLWFLACDGNVRTRDKTTGFFFSTEEAALFTSAFYYNKNRGRNYPYVDRLLELTNWSPPADSGRGILGSTNTGSRELDLE